MFYHLKKWIIQRGLNYRKRQHPFVESECELFDIRPEDPHAINNSYFLGAHTCEGEDLTLRMGKRNGGEYELFIIYRTADSRVLYQPQDHYSPRTMPLTVRCLTVGQQWQFCFDGQLRDASGKLYDVQLDVVFTATLPIYDFVQYPATHEGMTTAIAREHWSAHYFQQLGLTNQKHYEQQGRIVGSITVDGQSRSLDWPAVRDRALGQRIWKQMNCHIWINVTTDAGESLTFSLVSYPMLDSLFTGYHTLGSNGYHSLTGYRLMDYDHHRGLAPDHFKVYTEWSDGRRIILEAWRDTNVVCTFDHSDYVFQEGLGYVRINGMRARGNLEYGFNRLPERWGNYLPTHFARKNK